MASEPGQRLELVCAEVNGFNTVVQDIQVIVVTAHVADEGEEALWRLAAVVGEEEVEGGGQAAPVAAHGVVAPSLHSLAEEEMKRGRGKKKMRERREREEERSETDMWGPHGPHYFKIIFFAATFFIIFLRYNCHVNATSMPRGTET